MQYLFIASLWVPAKARRHSLVAQDPFLLHATLRENLDFEGVCTDEQIWAALDKVGMKEAVEQLEIKDESQPKTDETKAVKKSAADAEEQVAEEQKGKQSNRFNEKPSSSVDKLSFVLEDSGSFSRGQVSDLLSVYEETR